MAFFDDDVARSPVDDAELVFVPAGGFLMGSDDSDPEAFDDERPLRSATTDEFYIYRYPVTNVQFASFAGATQYAVEGKWEPRMADAHPMHPVTEVTLRDAAAYCQWAGGRLPTEEEWEKAARGVDGRRYPWGDEWVPDYAHTVDAGSAATMPITAVHPAAFSPYGAGDMAGNTWDWTASPYPGKPATRVVRGGSFL